MTAADTQHLPRFSGHPLRDAVLGEIHARPFRPLATPRVIIHYAFCLDGEGGAADMRAFAEFCRAQGAPGPDAFARYHTLPFAGGTLSWERHTEFTTYTWDGPLPKGDGGLFPPVSGNHPFGQAFQVSGPMMVAMRIDLMPDADLPANWADGFDAASLTASGVEQGAGFIATDFRADGNGMTRALIVNKAMTPSQAGTIVQRLLEVETYRTFALLGLFEANRLQPDITAIENELADLTQQMQGLNGLQANRKVLEELSRLAARLEAGAAASSYRFGASRAYYEITTARLEALREEPLAGYLGLAGFLRRRLAPAMRTCQSVEDRQANLSRKLARATTLLRTRVDVDLEDQNRTLLERMNHRARLQLRLQQTVEGLSVAAVSYYVVGLVSYVIKAAKKSGLPMPEPELATGLAVPVVVLAIWWTVRRIRAHHAEEDAE
ncbi:DUF3422 family protein [Roseibium aestuarii]|uniref:DUF3422 family protein n=1 Tax=Roseibium aestuarii TaxID=2600299 RepID=A0ABW4JTA7_9HYPH|nr:DUF3422 domain-containing protein [Roseibium aestuarii]